MVPIIIIIVGITVVLFLIIVFFRSVFGGKSSLKNAMRLESAGRLHDALAAYDLALSKGNSTPELRWKIANVAYKLNLFQRAQKELTILISTKSLPANVSLSAIKQLLASSLLKTGNEKQAFVELYEAAKMDQNNTSLFLDLGRIYAGQAKTQKAIDYFEKFVSVNLTNGEAFYLLGKAYLDNGNPVKALENLEKALRFKFTDNGKVNYYLAILYYSQKKYNLAMQQAAYIIKQKSSDKMMAEAHKILAMCYREKGLIDEALTSFEQANQYNKTQPKDSLVKESLYNQGVLLIKKGKLQNALEVFQKILLIDPVFKDVRRIVDSLNSKLKGIGDGSEINLKFIDDNLINSILKKGLLYSSVRFDIDRLEAEIDKRLAGIVSSQKSGVKNVQTQSSTLSVEKINQMPTKDFKEIARKLVVTLGFEIKAEPKFQGDTEYLDGNAINFLVEQGGGGKKKEILFTMRRYDDEVPELSVGNFLDWLEERGISQGVFIATSMFSKQVLHLAQEYQNVKFIDKNGLAKMLGRIR